jgi:hypothetical protein
MFQAGTEGGPIGLYETSVDLLFIFDRVTKKAFDGNFTVPASTHAEYNFPATAELTRAIKLETIARKYMFESVTTCLRRFITQFAYQDPPQALAFAVNLQPPDGSIVKAAFKSFKNEMMGAQLAESFEGSGGRYVPAAQRMKWRFVEEKLGPRAYHAYVKATAYGVNAEFTGWNWDSVAVFFMKELGIEEGSAVI